MAGRLKSRPSLDPSEISKEFPHEMVGRVHFNDCSLHAGV